MLKYAASPLTRPVAAPCLNPTVLAKFLPSVCCRSTSDAASRRGKPFTKEEDDLILRCREDGVSYANIAKKLGRGSTGSIDTRYRLTIAQGDSKHQDQIHERMSSESRALMTMIKERIDQGQRESEVARELGLPEERVRYLARLSGSRSRREYRRWTVQETRQLCDMRAKGMTWADIAIVLGRSFYSVQFYGRDHMPSKNRHDSTDFGKGSNADLSPLKRSWRKWTAEELIELRELFKAQRTVPEIAQRLQRTHTSVKGCMQKHKLTRQSSVPDTIRSDVVRLKEVERLKWREISDKVGRSVHSVQGIYRKYGNRHLE